MQLIFNKDKLGFYLLLAAMIIFAWVNQNNFPLNPDTSWLLHSVQMYLQGLTYENNFFSPNPPATLFLYLPPVVLHNWLGINLPLALKSYIFLLATCSWLVCGYFAKKILAANSVEFRCFLLMLAAVFLIFPQDQLVSATV